MKAPILKVAWLESSAAQVRWCQVLADTTTEYASSTIWQTRLRQRIKGFAQAWGLDSYPHALIGRRDPQETACASCGQAGTR